MDINVYNKRKQFIVNVLYFSFIAVFIYILTEYLFDWLTPFIAGFFIASILKPLINFLHEKLNKIPKKLIATIMVIVFYGVVITIVTLLGWRIGNFVVTTFRGLPDTYEKSVMPWLLNINSWINDLLDRIDPVLADSIWTLLSDWMKYLSTAIESLSKLIISGATSLGKGIPDILSKLLISILLSVFITVDYQTVSRGMTNLIPKNMKSSFFEFKDYILDTVAGYFKAMGKILLITFVELSIGLGIIGIENFIIIAGIIALLDILPVLGSGTVLIPWVILSVIKSDYRTAIGLIVIYAVITVVRQVIEPRIVGREMGIHPVLSILCLYLGFRWKGLVGMFILLISTTVVVNFFKEGKNPFNLQNKTETANEDVIK